MKNFKTETDYLNHQIIIKYAHLERVLDFKYQNEDNVMRLVQEMVQELRDEKIKKLIDKDEKL